MYNMRPNPSRTLLALTLLGCSLLCCCASRPTDSEPTLKTLAGRPPVVVRDEGVAATQAQVIEAYTRFLEAAPQAPQRAQALRRIGDLEMDSADRVSGETGQDPDYRAAIARYQSFLKNYPVDPGNDRVLYQLARAYDQVGAVDVELKTLDRLVRDYPATSLRDEAQFRRGELLFSARDYGVAEKAYATVLAAGPGGPYFDRSLYMQGWSQFKQARLDDALHSFFGVLDVKLVGHQDDRALETLAGLSRADRELLEDTFRVTSICLANLQGGESIPAYIDSPLRRGYEFRVYQQLGELYLKQERVKDTADTFGLFARRNPLHSQTPLLQARVIAIYEQNGFAKLALDAKKEYVAHYGAGEFRRASPQAWQAAQPLVKTHLAELAQHYHASAQSSRSTADYQEAVRWYRLYLESFPSDIDAAQTNFLLAELLFEDARFAQATLEYEKTAYGYPAHPKSADAGYAALLSHAQQLKVAESATPALRRAGVASALSFAQAFAGDARVSAVLADAADTLYALHDADQATLIAQRVLDLQPATGEAQRRVAWTVLAHSAFEHDNFDRAEKFYTEVLKLTVESDPARKDLVERQAASIYKQGEQARTAGQSREAVEHFARVGSVAPQSALRATAQYDSAAALIALKDWDGARRTLEDFRQRFPNHPLQDEVGAKLALAYVESGQWAGAAGEFERLAAANKDPAQARDALWRAAEYHEKAGAHAAAEKTYESYLVRNPEPLVPALEARYRLAGMAREDGNVKRELALMKDILQADQNGGNARTDRTRYLGASAALALAEPVAQAYRSIALTEPLQKQLKLKKARLEETLKAYGVAADYGVPDVTTAVTYRIATLYRDFGTALMSSQRPKKLKKLELEQYNVLLEEQAFPFEEKAAELHELNTRRAASGIYDQWVQSSFDALRELRPVRYGKTEQSAVVPNAGAPVSPAYESAASLNQLGVTLRRQGQFEQARAAYERAIALDPTHAAAILNLGILLDLYLGDAPAALARYQRYLTLSPAGDALVSKWVAELQNRKPAAATVSQKE
jgi:tetratricopeptide (TPR) repeat protein